MLTAIWESLPVDIRLTSVEDASVFPELILSGNTGEWQETEGGLLSFRTPQSSLLGDAEKKLCIFFV